MATLTSIHRLGKRRKQGFVWVEYPCERCETIHRKRYTLIADEQFFRHFPSHAEGRFKVSHRGHLIERKVCIHELEYPTSRHTIFYDPDQVDLEELRKIVQKYTYQHFSVKNLASIKVKIEN